MSRKKEHDRRVMGKKFKNTPFNALKGRDFSDEDTSAPKSGGKKDAPRKPIRVPRDYEGLDFLDEMLSLGVKPLGKSTPDDAQGATGIEPVTPCDEEIGSEKGQDEEALFLEALGQMDTTFRDELPSSEPPAQAVPRRMREFIRGRRIPDAEIDLHGLNREQARQRVAYFLDNCCFQGHQTALLITGRGRGSEQQPVLRGEIENFLNGPGRRWAVEWGRAPKRYGGEGALVVFLRKKKQ